MHDKDDIPDLLTPDDLERLFKIPKATQAALRSRKAIPFIKIGPRTPRYRRKDIKAWLDSRFSATEERGVDDAFE